MSISRRNFLCVCSGGLALAGCGGGGDATPPAVQTAQVKGCGYSSSLYGSSYPGCGNPSSSSGNAAVDNAFAVEFNIQRAFWGVTSGGFAFLNDCDSPNAYAAKESRAIYFGLSMAQQMYSRFNSAVPLWQILAHEFGHLVQFYQGADWLRDSTVAPTELEADMFSGFYLIYTKPVGVRATLKKVHQLVM